jgi:hypothetical protein
MRGHRVDRVRDLFPTDIADIAIATWADNEGAIVVTCDKHYKAIIQRVPEGERQRFRNAGRISFDCKQTQARKRVEQFIDLIEAEYEQTQQHHDHRCIIEITSTLCLIVR